MAGISSKALNGAAENNLKYNGIEFTQELELNLYDAEYRELDPSIARWWQIDPVTDGYEDYSPYASMYNSPIRISDPLGNEGEECCGGLMDALIDAADNLFLTGSGVVNGMLNTVSGGLISTDPFDMRWALSVDKQQKYDAAVMVGQIGPLFGAAGGRVTPGRAPILQTNNGVAIELPVTARPSIAPSTTVKATGNSEGGKGAQNAKVKESINTGNKAHKDFSEKAKAKGMTITPALRDPLTGKTVYPDAVTKSGKPLELKPNTPSGRAKGAKQLEKYERATGQKGRVVTYDPAKFKSQ